MGSAHKDFESFANHWRYDLTTNENGFYQDSITQRVFDAWSCSSDRIAELERENETLKAKVEVAEAGFHAAIAKSAQQYRTNSELNRLLAQIEDMKELCLTTGEVNQIKAEAVLDAANQLAKCITAPPGMHSSAVSALVKMSDNIRKGV